MTTSRLAGRTAGLSPAALASDARRLLRPPVPAEAEPRDVHLDTAPPADPATAPRPAAPDAGMNTAVCGR
ncbi:hypothetical protein [Catellatospora sp. NPDC049609]|uniref:hypothetical protein n=1 Tax=Catellatospora sp. NPDC049609 TaxID=3155505 RepID=UPI00343059DC